MNPFLWVLVVLFALDALRESLGLSSFSGLVDFVGGNFANSQQLNYRLNVPQFRELYEQGKTDRKAGRTLVVANEYAQSIRDQVLKGVKTNNSFTGNKSDQWSSDMEEKDAKLFGNELAASYLDGYNGVQ